MNYKPGPGEHVRETATRICALATEHGEVCLASFNEIELRAEPGGDPDAIVAEYTAECERQAEAYRRSPAGQEAAGWREEADKRAAAAAAEGILPFAVRDPEKWQASITANTDGYGACVIRYAARWAHLMDAQIAGGASVPECAEMAGSAADVEGITGFMYGCAVSILAVVWEHGEALRRWHNHETQIGDEGDRANESGGVLNPALLLVNV